MKKSIKNQINKILADAELMQIIACYCIVVGLIVFPIHFQYALLQDELKLYGRVSVLFLVAVWIFMYLKAKMRKFDNLDKVMIFIWIVSMGLVLIANYSIKTAQSVVVISNLILPAFILSWRFEFQSFSKFMRHFLIVFDVFIVLLCVICIFEKFTGSSMLTWMADALSSKEYKNYLKFIEEDVWRSHTIWGHALTGATLFNGFFILNDIYFRSQNKKYPKLLFFGITLVGVGLCSSKTAIVVLLAYLIVSSWKHKKFLIVCGVLGVVILALGGFNILIERLTSTPLTTGRFDSIITYFESGLCPLKFINGYGTGAVYGDKLYDLRAGFEFPVMMSSLDYGILFTILMIVGMYIYVSYFILKRKQVSTWLGFSLLFAEYNTFNGISLSNQDNFAWLCLFSMLMINCALCNAGDKKEKME